MFFFTEKYAAVFVLISRDSVLLSTFLLFYILENITCRDGTFQCRSGECIALSLQCDFNDDCFDGSDELNCGTSSCCFSFFISVSGVKQSKGKILICPLLFLYI